MNTPTTPRSILRPAAILFVVAFVAYLPVLGSGFLAWDDPDTVLGNAAVAGAPFSGLIDIWSGPVFFTYLPVYFTSLWADCLLFGDWAGGFHVVNVLLHFLNALVLMLVIRRLTRTPFVAEAAAILFLLHPAATESVVWISERKGLLAFLFAALAFLWFQKAVQGDGERRWRRHAIGTGLLVLAMLAKGSALVLPFLLLLYVAALGSRISPRPRLKDVAPYLVVTFLLTAMHYAVAVAEGPAIAGGEGSTMDRLLTGFPVFARYLRLSLLPLGGQSAVPDVLPVGVVFAAVAIGLVALAAYATALAVTWRRNREIFFGLAAIAICLVPFNNVFPKTTVLFAERYLYFSLAGAALVGGWLLSLVPGRRRVPVNAAVSVLLLVLTFLRAGVWTDGIEVFADARAKNETSWLAAMKHGDALLREGIATDAEDAYEAAVRNGGNDAETAKARLSKANAMLVTGAEPAAILATLEPVDGLLPGLAPDLRIDLRWDLETKRGYAHWQLNRPDRSAEAYAAAVRAKPKLALSHANLCQALARLGRVEDAAEAGATAVRLEPDNEDAAIRNAEVLVLIGRIKEAYRGMEAFLVRRPGSVRGLCLTGELDLTLSRPRFARKRFAAALECSPGLYRAVRGLAASDLLAARAAFSRGLVREARELAERARATNPEDPRAYVFLATMAPTADEADRLLRRAADLPDGRIGRNALATHRMRQAVVRDSKGDEAGAARGVAGAIRARPDRLVAGTSLEIKGGLDRLRELADGKSPGRDKVLVAIARYLAERHAEAGVALSNAYQLEVAAGDGGSVTAGLALLLRGRARAGAGRYREALDDFDVVSGMWPEDPWPWLHRADALLRAGAAQLALAEPAADPKKLFAGARSAAQKALALDPKHLPSRLKLGQIEFAAGEYIASLRAFDEVKRDFPGRVEPMLDLATLYRAHYLITGEKKYLDEALTELAAAVVLEPGNARVRALNGEILLAAGEAPRAAEELRVAIAADPGLLEARQALTRLFVNQARGRMGQGGRKNREEARKLAMRAKALESELAAPHLVLADIYRLEKDFAPALEELIWAKLREADSDAVKDALANYHKDLGYAHLLVGRKKEALAEFTKAVDVDSKNVDLDQVRLLLGFDESEAEGPALDPAVAALLREKTEEARKWFETAAERRRAEDLDGALDALVQSRKARTSAEAWVETGRIRYMRRESDAAEKAFRAAIKLKSSLPEAHLGLGNVLYLRHDYRGAIVSYRRFLRTSSRRGETDTRIRVKALLKELEKR